MKSTGHVDFVTFSYPSNLTHSVILNCQLEPENLERQKRTLKRYERGFKNDLGVLLFESDDPAEGNFCVLSGDTLHNARANGLTDDALFGHLTAQTPHFSRVDVCVNIHDGRFTPALAERWFVSGRLQTRAQKGKRLKGLMTSKDDGLYIGSPRSDRLVRIYDKAAELHMTDTKWVRVELQARNRQARSIAFSMADNPDPRSVVNAAISDFLIPPPRTELRRALRDRTADIIPPEPKEPSIINWIFNQVVPALVKHKKAHPERDLIKILLAEYERRMSGEG